LLAGTGGGKFIVHRLTNGGRNARYRTKATDSGVTGTAVAQKGRTKRAKTSSIESSRAIKRGGGGQLLVREVEEEEEEAEEEEEEEGGTSCEGARFCGLWLVASRISTTRHLWVQMHCGITNIESPG
jgi:hypothetical protein